MVAPDIGLYGAAFLNAVGLRKDNGLSFLAGLFRCLGNDILKPLDYLRFEHFKCGG